MVLTGFHGHSLLLALFFHLFVVCTVAVCRTSGKVHLLHHLNQYSHSFPVCVFLRLSESFMLHVAVGVWSANCTDCKAPGALSKNTKGLRLVPPSTPPPTPAGSILLTYACLLPSRGNLMADGGFLGLKTKVNPNAAPASPPCFGVIKRASSFAFRRPDNVTLERRSGI